MGIWWAGVAGGREEASGIGKAGAEGSEETKASWDPQTPCKLGSKGLSGALVAEEGGTGLSW